MTVLETFLLIGFIWVPLGIAICKIVSLSVKADEQKGYYGGRNMREPGHTNIRPTKKI